MEMIQALLNGGPVGHDSQQNISFYLVKLKHSSPSKNNTFEDI